MSLQWYIYCCRRKYVTDTSNNARDKKLGFKSNVPFISCILKINNRLIGNAEELDIVISMYSLIEYRKSYSKATGILWHYCRDEPNSRAVGNINYSIRTSKSLDCKTCITGRLEGSNTEKDVEIVCTIKTFKQCLEHTRYTNYINCSRNIVLSWFENCVITSKATRDADPDADPAVTTVNNRANAT